MQVLQDFHRLFMSNSTTMTIYILHNYLEIFLIILKIYT